MAVQTAGISTLGIKLGYAVETVAGQKPAAFKWLERCNNINGIDLPTEKIDASALEDMITKYIAGRQDSGGDWPVTFNYTSEVATQLKAMIAAYNTGKQSNLNTWFEVWTPYATDAFYVVAQPPQKLPMPEMGQNELMTIEISLTIEDYKGEDTGIEPVADTSTVAVTGVTLNKSTTSIAVSANETLVATVAPANATNKAVTWSSSDTEKATVDSNGKVVGVAAGSATITVTTTDGSFTDTCTVTVTS